VGADLTSSLFVARTDHPFFPPLASEGPDAKWMSVVENLKSIDAASGWSEQDKEGVRGRNAIELFGLL
jgi:aminocarboxymuconate-semialdehyde decarboxylase